MTLHVGKTKPNFFLQFQKQMSKALQPKRERENYVCIQKDTIDTPKVDT